ncbi:hypothetical protein DE146DRAFT_755981 [Phaeosphaeria sp. MPI-PUGE-AT-0046c]|nr:hypothetical protein DE146DRAFT_755981 [Phaeosphaeria sp. MPI-PUGE-AT-0046c]
MFFSKQSSSATSGNLALQQDVSLPLSPVNITVSPVTSLAPPAATTASVLPAKAALFSKWQRSTTTSSTLLASVSGESPTNELLKRNSILLDQVDGLKQVEELNQLTKHKLAEDLEAKENGYTQLRKSVRQLTAELECSRQAHQDQTFVLQAELSNLTLSRDVIVQERDELAKSASTLNTHQALLQQRNNAPATRIATAEDKVKKYELGTNALTRQVKSFIVLSAQQQQSSKDQVDAIYAQQLRMEQHADEQLEAKDAVIRELQARLEQSEAAATKAIGSRDVGHCAHTIRDV